MRLNTRELTITALFAALIIVGAFLKIDIPLPLYTMHFTLQWFFVLMAGLLLGSKLGALSVTVYLLLGLSGIPVFASGGGIGYILKPTFGFLLGFAFAAYVIGYIAERMSGLKGWQLVIPATVGLFIYYGFGAVYFYFMKNLYVGEAVSFVVVVVQYCLITIIPDFILCVLAARLAYQIKPAFRRIGLVRSRQCS